jgi:hypothetical protein
MSVINEFSLNKKSHTHLFRNYFGRCDVGADHWTAGSRKAKSAEDRPIWADLENTIPDRYRFWLNESTVRYRKSCSFALRATGPRFHEPSTH